MRGTPCLAAIVAAMLLAGAPTDVGAQSAVIVTAQPPPTLAAWSERVFRDIDKQLQVPEGLGTNRTPSGIAAVKFNCSETGAPADVAVYKSSGSRELDRATLSAVRRVASLHPLPTGLGHDQVYIVRILFSDSQQAADRQIARMQREAAKNNAWYGRPATRTAAIEIAPPRG